MDPRRVYEVRRWSGVGRRGADVGERRLRVAVDRKVTERHDADQLLILHDGEAPQRLLTHELAPLDRRWHPG